MVTEPAGPQQTKLGRCRRLVLRLRQLEAWLGHMTKCVAAARVPILVAAIYVGVMVWPDQTAEVIRSTFETSRLWLFWYLIGWGLLTVNIVAAFYAATRLAFDDYFTKRPETRVPKPSPALDRTQFAVLLIVTLSPVGALSIAFATSLDQNVLAAFLSHWKAILFFLLCPLFVGASLIFSFSLEPIAQSIAKLWGVMLFGWVFIGAALWFVVIVVLGIASYFTAAIPDPPAVWIFSAWIIMFLGLLMLLEHWWRIGSAPFIALLMMWALLLAYYDVSDNHVVRTASSPKAMPPNPMEPMEVGTVFDAWIKDRQTEVNKYKPNRKYPVFLIAAEGGGSRAAYMTTLVLETLREHCPDAIRHTFLITAVSGGSVGALFASAGVNWDKLRTGCEENVAWAGSEIDPAEAGPRTTATKAAGTDFLRSVLQGFLFGEIPGQLLPSGMFLGNRYFTRWSERVARWTDPAQSLENGIDRAWRRFDESEKGSQHNLSKLGFRELWAGGLSNSLAPALVFLTTDVGSGRRIAVSHLMMPTTTKDSPTAVRAAMPASASTAGHEWQDVKDTTSIAARAKSDSERGRCVEQALNEGVESRARLLTLNELMPGIDVPAATAAVLSARFPGITAAGRLPCPGPARRLVDGGYFENSGLTTVLELLGELKSRSKDVSFVIVQIENSRASSDWSYAKGKRSSPPSGRLSEVMSPLRAIIATSQARADLTRKALVNTMPAPDARECQSKACDEYRVLFELRPCSTPIPLGWSLSETAQGEIRRQLFDPAADGSEEECVKKIPVGKHPRETHGKNNPNVMNFKQIFTWSKQGIGP